MLLPIRRNFHVYWHCCLLDSYVFVPICMSLSQHCMTDYFPLMWFNKFQARILGQFPVLVNRSMIDSSSKNIYILLTNLTTCISLVSAYRQTNPGCVDPYCIAHARCLLIPDLCTLTYFYDTLALYCHLSQGGSYMYVTMLHQLVKQITCFLWQ